MKFQSNFNLKNYNTFRIDCNSKFFVSVDSLQDLINLVNSPILQNNRFFILGAGSNILFSGDFDGIIIGMNIKGFKVISEDDHNVLIECGAGEYWHNFVKFCVENGYFGLENLALIPGKVGAAPVQNIGAYGIEQQDRFHSLNGFNFDMNDFDSMNHSDCKFDYRYSVFKDELKDKFIITSVTYKLSKTPEIKADYKDIQAELSKLGTENPQPADIFNIICKVRESKLPDTNVLGNAGSFFKNPVVTAEKANELFVKFPDIKLFNQPDGTVKISAGWLIEQCGFKGKRNGDAGVYEHHALVIVNHNSASGNEIIEFAGEITSAVNNKFGVVLEKEVIVL